MHHRVEIYLINCSVIPCPRGKIILAPSERVEIIYHILILPPTTDGLKTNFQFGTRALSSTLALATTPLIENFMTWVQGFPGPYESFLLYFDAPDVPGPSEYH